MTIKSLAIAAAIIVAPFAANAYSVNSQQSTIANGGTYDINAGPFFWDATFFGDKNKSGVAADGAGSVTFTFSNNSAGTSTVGVTQGTVLQFSGSFDGVTVSWGNGTSQSVAPGTNAIINVSSLLASGTSDTLTVAWGAVTGVRGNIDIDVAAVPLPAGFLLLGTALVGAGALARRRKV